MNKNININKDDIKKVKSINIDKNCKSFNRKELMCYHVVHITYDNDTKHKLTLSAEAIKNHYEDYITDDLRNHLFFIYDKLLFDDDYFINLDENHLNKYASSCCVIS